MESGQPLHGRSVLLVPAPSLLGAPTTLFLALLSTISLIASAQELTWEHLPNGPTRDGATHVNKIAAVGGSVWAGAPDILRSDDGGDTWYPSGLRGLNGGLHASDGSVYYGADSGGQIWVTSAEQQHWTELTPIPGSVIDVVAQGDELWVVGQGNSQVHCSVDGGITWQSTNVGGSHYSVLAAPEGMLIQGSTNLYLWWKGDNGLGRRRVSTFPKNPSLRKLADLDGVYYGTSSRGVFRSTDGGATWTETGFPDSVEVLTAVYTDRSSVWVAARGDAGTLTAGGVFRSVDGGPWEPVNEGFATPNVYDVAFVGEHVFAAAIDGVYRLSLASEFPPPGGDPSELDNLVANPSFEVDEPIQGDTTWTSWATWSDIDGLGSQATLDPLESIHGSRSLLLDPIGPSILNFVVVNLPIEVVTDEWYTFSFWAKGTSPRSVTARFKTTDNTALWEETDFSISTEWQEYHTTARAQGPTIKLEFLVGTAVPLWLDMVSLYEGGYIPGFGLDQNGGPSAEDAAIVVNEGATVSAQLVASASDGGAVTYVVSAPALGSLAGTAPDLTYTARRQPTVGFVAADSFTFQVTDAEGASDVGVVSITIAAVNDPPVAVPKTASVTDGASQSITLSASDADGDALSFTVVDAPAGTLTGNPPSLTYTPPAEHSGSDSFTFRASDGELQSALATVQISIGTLNHAPTAIALSDLTLDEGTAAGSVVGTLSTEDADEGDTHRYTILDDASGRFTVIDGELRLVDAARIDYEQSAQHTVRVHVIDAAGATFEQSLVIEVVNINEPPVAVTLTGSLIVENSVAGTLVGSLAALDPDSDDTHTYAFVGDAGPFELVDGELKVRDADALDYETAATHQLTIKATDAGGLSTQSTFTIIVVDLVELAGEIALDPAEAPENSADGVVVGSLSLQGGDRESEATYTLVTNADGRFALNGTTLSVASHALLDFEVAASHEVVVRASALDGLDVTETLTVAITNVNEAPTAMALDTSSIDEDAGGGAVVGTLSVVDPDTDDDHSYTLVSGATGLFELDGAELATAPGAALDYETSPQHELTLRVTDSGGLTYEQTLVVEVRDVPEAPESLTLDGSSVREDIAAPTKIGTLLATDSSADDTLIYTLVDDATGRFALNGADLWTADSATFDHETDSEFALIARVTDGTGLTLDETFTIDVEDVNEPPSNVRLSNQRVAENSLAEAIVGTLSADDPDEGDSLTYALVSAAGRRFRTDGDALIVAADNALDFESAAEHMVTVRVRDAEGLSVERDFTVVVENVAVGGLSAGSSYFGDVSVDLPAPPDGEPAMRISHRAVGEAEWSALTESHPVDTPYLLNTTLLADGAHQLRFDQGGSTIVSDPFVVSNTDTPTLTVDGVDGEEGVVTVRFTTTNPTGGDLATDGWEFSTDGASWRSIGLLQIGENFARAPGSHTITWDTEHGPSNLAEVDVFGVLLRMRVTDRERSSASAASPPFHIDNNAPPSIEVTPVSGEFSDEVAVRYTLYDPESDLLSIAGEYSADNGGTWQPATLEGSTEGLRDGAHAVAWLAGTDVPHIDREDVQLRLTPLDADPGEADAIAGIHIDTNEPPTVDVQDILGTVSADVDIQFTLSDAEGDVLSVRGEYSVDDGTSWSAATLAGNSLGTGPGGYVGTVVWASRVDLPSLLDGSTVRFQLTASDNDRGGSDATAPFLLVNTAPPTVAITNVIVEPLEDVVIEYRLDSEGQQRLWLDLEFSTDGGVAWNPARVTGQTEGFTLAEYVGSVTWHTVSAFPGAVVPVRIRLTPGDDQGVGVAAVSSDFTIANVYLPTDELATLRGHANWVLSVAFSPDSTMVASGSADSTVMLWDTASGQAVATLRGHSDAVWAVDFSPDGRTVASGGDDGTVKLWDVQSGEELATLRGGMEGVRSIAFSPDGSAIVSGGDAMVVWDTASRQEIASLQGHGAVVWSVAYSPDGATIASGSWDNTIRLWDAVSGQEVGVLQGHSDQIMSVAFSPDGATIASGGRDDIVRLWDVSSGREVGSSSGHSGIIWSVAFSPDGATLATGGADDTVRFRDVASGQGTAALHGHTDFVVSTAFSADGATMASGSRDGTVKLWTSSAIASNRPPTVAVANATVQAAEGSAVLFTVASSDPDGDALRLIAADLPSHAMFDPATGIFTFEPDHTQAGEYVVDFTANDGKFGTDTAAVTVTVSNVDIFRVDDPSPRLEEGDILRLHLAPVANLPDDIDVAAQGLPEHANFDAGARTLTFSPDLTQAGDYAVTFRVTQGGKLAEQHTVAITVDEARAFTLEPPAAGQVSEGKTLAITAERGPGVGADATLSAEGLPDGATFDAETGELRFTPDYTQAGNYVITLEASVGEEVVQTEQVAISVAEADAFTVAPGGDLAVAEGERLVVTVALAGGATEGVTLSVDDRPSHAAFKEATDKLSFTPDYTHAGEYLITVEATQNGEVVQSTDIAVTVTDTPLLTLTPSATTVAEGGFVTVIASILEGAPGDIAMTAPDLPPNAAFDASTGTITFSPGFFQADEHMLTVVAMQGGEVTGEESVTVVVENVPTFAIDPSGDQTLDEDASLTIEVVRAAGVPLGVLFSAASTSRNTSYAEASGTFQFSPDFGQKGPHTVVFQAAQDGEAFDKQTIDITVNDVDILTTNSTGAIQVSEGESVSVVVEVAPVAQGKVTLSAVGLPDNATFDATTRLFTFDPDHSQAGAYNVTIRATQGGRTVEQEPLRITVTDVNVPPTVTVTAPTTDVTGDVTVPYVIEDFDGDAVTLAFKYREGSSGAWIAANLDRSIENTRTYVGSVVWRSREDIPSTGGVDVAFRVTPADAEQGAATTTAEFRVVNLLGDYDDDRIVGFADLVEFTQAWNAQDISRDIGPAVGEVPDLELVRVRGADIAIDFDDLTTFVRMWNWSTDQAPLAVAAMMDMPESGERLSYSRRMDGGDWSTQRVDITAPFGSATKAARLTFAVDPEAVTVRVRDVGDARAVLLTRRDVDAGIVEVQVAWLDTPGDADPLVSLDLTALRPGDADVRVAFDIRDADGRQRRGVDVLPLRFELPPTATRLLPNYPNPFNPETWIPFELAEAAEVTVTIYDIEGSPVRSLSLGKQPAGRYRARDRAVYWDGTNDHGEAVASGVYVYELRAGSHRDIRRMVIRK